MQIIPVIDLMEGGVVRAVAGKRENYQPLKSRLCASSAPDEVVSGLLRLFAFPTIYIADLDAILQRGDNIDAVQKLVAAFPSLEFWLDAGAHEQTAIASNAAFTSNIAAVVGSETLSTVASPPDLSAQPRTILSLDFHGPKFLGPPELLSEPRLWPQRIIVMTLARVGTGDGPDLDALAAIKAKAEEREIFAAGGVRGASDLNLLQRMGITGALVTSALHDGRLERKELAISAKKEPQRAPFR
jgi:phosphoribosylformimino-5-aminoimidazole carboxamide ribotide isomerase